MIKTSAPPLRNTRSVKSSALLSKLMTIPVLVYHNLGNGKRTDINTIPTHAFQQQISFLAKQGYKTVTFKDVASHDILPEKPIILTFDDAYESVYHDALPILSKYQMRGVVFAISDFIGRTNRWDIQHLRSPQRHMSSEELNHLHDSGWEIGSHGQSHRAFTHMSIKQVRAELHACRAELERIIGAPVVSVAYPFGLADESVKELAGSTGYTFGCRTIRGNHTPASVFDIPRTPVYRYDSEKAVQRKLNRSKLEKLRLCTLCAPALLVPWYQRLFKSRN